VILLQNICSGYVAEVIVKTGPGQLSGAPNLRLNCKKTYDGLQLSLDFHNRRTTSPIKHDVFQSTKIWSFVSQFLLCELEGVQTLYFFNTHPSGYVVKFMF
jgi:hypothetical protein